MLRRPLRLIYFAHIRRIHKFYGDIQGPSVAPDSECQRVAGIKALLRVGNVGVFKGVLAVDFSDDIAALNALRLGIRAFGDCADVQPLRNIVILSNVLLTGPTVTPIDTLPYTAPSSISA